MIFVTYDAPVHHLKMGVRCTTAPYSVLSYSDATIAAL